MKKNNGIEMLRGFLMIMIVFFHYTYRFQKLYNIQTINFFSLNKWGSIGVGAFFIITGYFLIPKNLENYSMKDYLKKKILRIYPAYALCMTITFIVVQIWGLEGRETNFFDYVLNLTMINGFIGKNYVDGAHWYLTYLVVFYTIIGIILKVSQKTKVKLYVLLYGWILIKDAVKIIIRFVPDLSNIYVFTGGDSAEFIIIGIVIKKVFDLINFKQGKIRINKEKIKILVPYLGLLLISTIQIALFQGIITIVATILFLMIFIFVLKNGVEKQGNTTINPLVFLGKISYIVYLIHQNIGYQILIKLYSINQKFHLIYVLLTFLVIVLGSYIIYEIFEKRIQIIINEKLIKVNRN